LKQRILDEQHNELNYKESLQNFQDDLITKEDLAIHLEEGHLTISELEVLRYQLSLPVQQRNYFGIDRIISKNKFFMRFNKVHSSLS
jgi:hypothetical protein